MSLQNFLSSSQVEEKAWLEGLSKRILNVMIGPEPELDRVPVETRIQVLEILSTEVGKRAAAQAHELWKTRVQRTFLAGVSIFLFVVVGVGAGVLLHTESRATARAWRILVQRQLIAAKTGREAAKGGMVWLMAHLQEVKDDPSATPAEKELWVRNILQIAQQADQLVQMADQTVRRLSVAETPERIDSFTYFRDPFTGRTLPVNATDNGRIDDAAVAAYTKQDDQMLRLVAMAKAYSQKGATPLPPFLFDEMPTTSREKLNPARGAK